MDYVYTVFAWIQAKTKQAIIFRKPILLILTRQPQCNFHILYLECMYFLALFLSSFFKM